MVLGRWVHLGDRCSLRAHEGTLRIGEKTVLGREDTLNCYLDIDVGPRCIVADWVYVGDFDHRFDDLHVPIKDQGIVKSPVRIGADVWVGVKASVLRGARVGDGCVLAAHTVVRGEVPAGSVVAGVPGRVVRDRAAIYAAAAEHRAALADMARKHAQRVATAALLGATRSAAGSGCGSASRTAASIAVSETTASSSSGRAPITAAGAKAPTRTSRATSRDTGHLAGST